MRRVAVLGAGPVGLDAALACTDAGMDVTVYESGDTVAAHVRSWGHVRCFTPWAMNASARMRRHVGDRLPTGDRCPTGDELARDLLEPVAALPALAGTIACGNRVVAVARDGLLKHEEIATGSRAGRPFRLLIDGPRGEQTAYADLVLDCTGSYGHPNTIGDGGIPAMGERELDGRVLRRLPRLDDAKRWAGTVVLVGAGKSAQTAASELAALPTTRVEWVVRDPAPDWREIAGDTLPQRQRLVEVARDLAAGGCERIRVHTGAVVSALAVAGPGVRVTLTTTSGACEVVADHVLGLTGYTGDAALYRQLQVHECYATAAVMNLSAALLVAAGGDCLAQPAVGVEALRNPEPGFFILGAKSYGRLGTFLLRTGYEQVDQVVAAQLREPALEP